MPPGGRAVVAVRPSDAATDVDPMPGTVGSIKLRWSADRDCARVGAGGQAHVARGARYWRPAGPIPASGPACERVGQQLGRACGRQRVGTRSQRARRTGLEAAGSGPSTPGGACSSIGSGLSGPTGGLGTCGPSGRMWNCLWAS